MGTTDTQLQTGSGQFGFVLLIEGFPYVVHSGASDAAVVTAYAGTGWTQALPGLKVIGSIKQSIEPFKTDLDIPTLTFHVMDCDGNDTFGKAVWKSKPTISSRLNAVFQPAADGSGTITVRDNATGPAAFPSGGGTVYIGTRAISYSALSGSTGLTVSAAGAGVFAPFTGDGSNVYNRPQGLAEGQIFDQAAPPRVSDVPATWIGKHVALYIHRISGGVWDTRAQAHLEFAGTLAKLEDGDGVTVVTCHDMRKKIEDATLLRTQWVGQVKPGIYLRTGDKFKIAETKVTGTFSSGEFTVVASGASGDDECNAGIYDYFEFMAKLEAWLAADGTLTGTWAAYAPQRSVGRRTVFRVQFAADVLIGAQFYCNNAHLMEFMGFTDHVQSDDGGNWRRVGIAQRWDDERFIESIDPPYRTRALYRAGHVGAKMTLTLEDATRGTWLDHSAYLPPAIHHGTGDGDNWSYVIIGDSQLAVAEYSSDTELINVTPLSGFGQLYSTLDEFKAPGVTFDDPAEVLEVRQIVFLAGKFSSLIPKLFASIDGRGVNHATHDAFPWGAAVPYSLLGDTFVESCESIETADSTDTISIRLDRPTKLKDILIPEMALRFAFLIFKDGVFQFVSPPVPNSTTADHALDETNKAVGPGETEPMTATEWTSDYLTNVVKIQYKRDHAGKYQGSPITIKDQVSIDLHGESEPLTIDAINSVDENSSISGSTVEALAGNITSRVFPTFGYPVKIIRRTIAPSLYRIAPGDTVALSDNLVRDPTSGERGVSGRACVVLSSVHDYGHEGGRLMGEVVLLHSDEDRTYPLSPAAEVDTTYTSGLYTDGYDSTNLRLHLADHSFSKSTDALDVTRFAAGDLVRILEIDPADPASIDAWSRTVDSVGADYIQLTAALSSPAYSGATKLFAVIPQAYADVQASQKLHAFQADDGDGLVQDVVEPNSYGTQAQLGFTRAVATTKPALLADEAFGDGMPVTPYQLQHLTRMHNNLISYKTATHVPMMMVSTAGAALLTATGAAYALRQYFPVYIGGIQAAGRTRYLSIAPMFRSENGNAVYVKVTSSRFPPTGVSNSGHTFAGPTRSVEFTTSSTTAVVASAQNLTPVPAQFPGHTWISVELKVTGTEQCHCYGFPTFYLKPIT